MFEPQPDFNLTATWLQPDHSSLYILIIGIMQTAAAQTVAVCLGHYTAPSFI